MMMMMMMMMILEDEKAKDEYMSGMIMTTRMTAMITRTHSNPLRLLTLRSEKSQDRFTPFLSNSLQITADPSNDTTPHPDIHMAYVTRYEVKQTTFKVTSAMTISSVLDQGVVCVPNPCRHPPGMAPGWGAKTV